MNEPPTPTPRTDAQPGYYVTGTLAASYSAVPIDFARTLERELTATKAAWAEDIRATNEKMVALQRELEEEREAGLAQVRTIADCSIEINELKDALQKKSIDLIAMIGEAAEAGAERDRLREALEQIAKCGDSTEHAIARAALKAGKEEGVG
jgi:hypothetical protein